MLIKYIKAIFAETRNLIFNFFDILGIALFFCPTLAASLVDDESLVRVIGGIIFFVSFLLANFLLYKKLAEQLSYGADLHLKVLERGFRHSFGTTNSPFPQVRKSANGFNNQGIPDWGSLWARIKVANTGYEDGQLECELDRAKTKLPVLFDRDSARIEFYTPLRVAARSSPIVDLYFNILFTEQDPQAFARSLGTLVKTKQQYRVVLSYRTVSVDEESKTRKLHVKGDFQDFYRSVIEHWENYRFRDLAKIARDVADNI